MTTATGILIKAIKQLKIPYTFIDSGEAFIRLDFPTSKHFIINNTLGLVSNSDSRITKDKAYQYLLLKDVCTMPQTRAYLDPASRYSHSLRLDSQQKIVEDIMEHFKFPLMIKKNQGQEGVHVFKVHDKQELSDKIKIIFDPKSSDYDFVVLAQEYVEARDEYRVIFFNGKIYLAYSKNTPGKAENVSEALLSKLSGFVANMLQVWPIRYAGLDIIEDTNGNLRLLEANSAPAIAYYVKYNGEKAVETLYTAILNDLKKNYS